MIGHPEVSRVRHQLFVMVWTHFIHDFSITIQIRWICHLAVNQLLLAMAQFFTWRDSTAVVPHVKFCSDNSIRIWMRVKWNFHNIGIVIENCWRYGSLVGFIHKSILEPVSLRFFFHRNSKSMEISFQSHLDSNKWSLQNFVHGPTAVLSWRMQKFVAIWWPATELWQGEVSIELELLAKKR